MRRKIVLDLRLENNPEGPFTNFVDNQGGGVWSNVIDST